MPKYNKSKRQRILNAQRMNNYLKTQKETESGETVSTPEESATVSTRNIHNTGITAEHQWAETAPKENPEYVEQLLANETENETVDMEELPYMIETETTGNTKEKHFGRRIIDVGFFFAELKRISRHGPLGYGFDELEIIGEKQNGLQSRFTVICRLRNQKFYIDSDSTENYLHLNKCAVAGSIATGGGHSQLTELLSAMNLPVLSEKTYSDNHNFISKKWEEFSIESMQEAAEEEVRLAVSGNRVNKDGIPIIDVIADGCWSKRSYKKVEVEGGDTSSGECVVRNIATFATLARHQRMWVPLVVHYVGR